MIRGWIKLNRVCDVGEVLESRKQARCDGVTADDR